MSRRTKFMDRIAMGALARVPKNAASRVFGALSDLELPTPVQSTVNRGFAAAYGIDVSEASEPIAHYKSLNQFFTRRLGERARPIRATGSMDVTSPVDGVLTQLGYLEDDSLVQAKGKEYRLVELLDSAEEARRFAGGAWATVYLSPSDYHRIHAPVEGVATKVSYIPGQLWPVNPLSVRSVDRLFAVNERVVVFIDVPEMGRVAVIMVGATCVGRISLAFHGLKANQSFRRRQDIDLTRQVELTQGDELAVFNLGSTVVLLFEKGGFRFSSELIDGQAIQMGQPLGSWIGSGEIEAEEE